MLTNSDVYSARNTCVILTTWLTLVSCLMPAPEQPGDSSPHPALCPNHSGDPGPPQHWVQGPGPLTVQSKETKGTRLSSSGLQGPSDTLTTVQIPFWKPICQHKLASMLIVFLGKSRYQIPEADCKQNSEPGSKKAQSGLYCQPLHLLLALRNWTLRQTASAAERVAHSY